MLSKSSIISDESKLSVSINKNNSISTTELPWTPSFTWILFFFGFWGLDVIAVLVNYLFQNTRYAIDSYSLGQIIYLFLCLYGIFIVWRISGIHKFYGISIPLLIYMIMVTCTMSVTYYHQVVDSSMAGWIQFGILLRHCFIFVIPVFLFSYPIPKNTYNIIFYTILSVLLIYSLLIIGYFLMDIINGCTMRDFNFGIRFKKIFANPIKNSCIHSNFASILGAVLASYIFWAWGNRKMEWWLSIVLYTIGLLCMYFAASRNAFIGMLLTHILIVLISDFRKRNYYLFFLILCLGIQIIIGSWFMPKVPPKGYVMTCADIFTRIKHTIETNQIQKYIMVIVKTKLITENTNNTDETKLITENTDNTDEIKLIAENTDNTDDTKLIAENTNNINYVKEEYDYVQQIPSLNLLDEDGRITMLKGTIYCVIESPFFTMRREVPLKLYDGRIVSSMPHSMFFDGFLIGGIPGGILLTYIFFRAFWDSIYVFKNIPELGFIAVIHILIFFCSFFEFQTGSSRGDWLFLTIVILRGVVLIDQIQSVHKESTAET